MKACLACHDTSPDDARFCITCGHSFAVTGVTQRMSSAGAQTMRLEGDEPSSVASAAPVGFRTFDEVRSDMGLPPVGGAVGADWMSLGSAPYRLVYAGGNNAGSVYIPWSDFGYFGFGSADSIIVKVQS